MTTADWLSEREVEAANTARDRGRTARLLGMLRDPALPEPLRRSTIAALAWIDDPRAYGPLRELLEDVRLDVRVREAAASVFATGQHAPLDGVDAWWARREDPTLERLALLHMGREHESVVLGVLADPAHRAYPEAIETLAGGFDHPRFIAHAVGALSHRDPRVRRAAIEAVLFTEPTAALAPLLALLDDPSAELAAEALETLAWYDDSREMLLGVAAFYERTSNDALRERAAEILEGVAGVFATRLAQHTDESRAHLREWLEPIWSLISDLVEDVDAGAEPEFDAPLSAPRRPYRWTESVEAFCARFGDTDQPFRPLDDELARCDWSAVHPGVRSALGDALLAWPDPSVRAHAPVAFVAWQDPGRMLELLDDPSRAVAAAASYYARELGHDAPLAARVRARLERGERPSEAFESFVALSPPAEWHALARALLASPETGEDLRRTVAHALSAPSAVGVLREHLPLLLEPPRSHWGFHVALLDSARAQRLFAPDLAHLRDADHFGLQCSLAAYLAGARHH